MVVTTHSNCDKSVGTNKFGQRKTCQTLVVDHNKLENTQRYSRFFVPTLRHTSLKVSVK